MDSQHIPVSLRAPSPAIVAAFLQEGIDVRIRLSGHSMKPWLRTGSVLRFSDRIEPGVGDIVLLSYPNGPTDKLVAHRVLAVGEDRVWTKGDSSRAPDPPMPRARVLATAVAIETTFGSVPVRNVLLRRLGLLSSALYPGMVRTYRAVWPRKRPKEASACAS